MEMIASDGRVMDAQREATRHRQETVIREARAERTRQLILAREDAMALLQTVPPPYQPLALRLYDRLVVADNAEANGAVEGREGVTDSEMHRRARCRKTEQKRAERSRPQPT